MIGIESKYSGAYFAHEAEVKATLAKLKDNDYGITDYMLLSNDGLPIVSSLRERDNIDTHRETISIMAATIKGAANTANRELKKSSPNVICVDSQDAKSIIMNVGVSHILIVSGTPDLEKRIDGVQQIAKSVADILDAD
jgi:predicted regulator of Ras-like GTPase activity (Roadblock/LC7/MglB family)